MRTVEFLYDRDCPNVEGARVHLLKAFARAGLTPRWSEYLIGDPTAPRYAHGFGSPTILVDGHDVSGAVPGVEHSCRLYASEDGGVSRVPDVSQITAALSSSSSASRGGTAGWRSQLAVAPGIGTALLPTVVCPACWPAYAGFLSSIGVGFLIDRRWMVPLTTVFLLVAVSALAFRAPARRGYGPVGLGVIAAAIILGSKFVFQSDISMYAGLVLLVAASLWNSWPRDRKAACSNCARPI